MSTLPFTAFFNEAGAAHNDAGSCQTHGNRRRGTLRPR